VFVEIIYETGAKSVAQYDTEDEALAAIEAHHNRAVSGEPGGPYGGVAERVKKVLIYNEHPGDLNSSGLLPVEEVKTELLAALDELSMGGQISNMELAAKIRALSDSHVANPQTAHDSQYKMQQTGELEGAWIQ
jgi:hypothetical protein